MENKFCKKCQTYHPLTEFHKDKHKPDGLNAWCKNCKREERFAATRQPVNYLKRRWDNMAKGDRKKRDITYEELLLLWKEFMEDNIKMGLHPFSCAYTHEPMTFIQGQGHINTNLSCDRINNLKPYTKDNITFCTFKFNNTKGEMDINNIKQVLQFFKRKGIKYETKI
jgi:hypothetical protein